RVRSHELPGAIERAVPVESPGESGALELVHVKVHVSFAQPQWQGVRIFHQVEELGRPRLGRTIGRLAGGPEEDTTDGRPDIQLELGFGDTGGLEIEHV